MSCQKMNVKIERLGDVLDCCAQISREFEVTYAEVYIPNRKACSSLVPRVETDEGRLLVSFQQPFQQNALRSN